MAAWRSTWYEHGWRGDQYRSNSELEDVRSHLDDLTSQVFLLKDECKNNRRQLNELVDDKKILLARVAELEKSKIPEQQQISISTARGSGSRRNRPRSGSLPPEQACFWHEAGNSRSNAIPDYGLDTLRSALDAYDWWNHIAAVMFSDRSLFADDFWKWLEHQFGRRRITIQCYYSANVRHFVLNCSQCEDKFIMCYGNKTLEVKIQLIKDLADFTQCTKYVGCVGYCPRKRHDALLALMA